MATEPGGSDKKSRWRKDKKEAPASDQPPATLSSHGQPNLAVNEAAARAFKGLHGAKSDFSLFNGAMDDAYKTVLEGNAFYYQNLVCPGDDYSMYESISKELEYVPCWMSGGMPLCRPSALGSEEALKKSPTYERILRWVCGYFGVEPIRSLVNFYRDGDDYTSHHSDQYFTGVDMTIGVSLGDERNLLFEHRQSKHQFSFPQHNGDIFAFTNEVNDQFTHAVPREKRRSQSVGRRHTPGRVSVILWAKRNQPDWKRLSATKPLFLNTLPHVLPYDPKFGPPTADATASLEEEKATNEDEPTKEHVAVVPHPEADSDEDWKGVLPSSEENQAEVGSHPNLPTSTPAKSNAGYPNLPTSTPAKSNAGYPSLPQATKSNAAYPSLSESVTKASPAQTAEPPAAKSSWRGSRR